MTSPIVAAARGWLGTRFYHQGRLKKTAAHAGGVDCLGLLIGVATELDLRHNNMPVKLLDERDYPHYPDTARLRKKLSEIMQEIPTADILPGDILLLSIDDNPQHLAIVSDKDTGGGYGLIHAYAPARAVVEHGLDDYWRAHIAAAYRLL